ncbi:MAG: HDOD domain-containing protein [Archangiaceae bacterium]|nr:HDOD domain-containing protein [Archangiaceae bacterium]
MMRLLFVDDEPVMLSAMRARLRRHREGWSMRFVESGPAALEALEQEPADVVVSDQNMPGMLGTQLLEQVRRRCPQALRVLLSGHSEGAALHDGLRVAHQFIAKPCSLDELTVAVKHLYGLRESFDNPDMQRVIHAVDELPTPNAVFQELDRALSDPEVDARVVATIAERDPGLSLQLLKLANSAFYAMPPVAQVVKAVQRLGLAMVKAAATYAQLSGAVEQSLSGCRTRVELMQQRSLTVANVARRLLPGEAGQQAYLAGLLHDVGGLVLLASLPEHREVLFQGDPWPFVRAGRERALLGFTHAEVGAYLLGTWGQPSALVHGVAQQHAPTLGEDKAFDIAGAVHVAQRLAMEHAAQAGQCSERAPFDVAYLTACGKSLPALTELAFGREKQ